MFITIQLFGINCYYGADEMLPWQRTHGKSVKAQGARGKKTI
jgi:hypothetical protein